MIRDKKELELKLEEIPRFTSPKKHLEQYETPSSIVAHMLWHGLLNGDVEDKVIADLGCGSARFAIGSLLIGSRLALCIDIDEEIMDHGRMISKDILEPVDAGRVLFIVGDVGELLLNSVDTVFMNPPFGVLPRNRGLDMIFIRKALQISNAIYTLHKYSVGVDRVINNICEEAGFKLVHRELLDFPIPMTYERHRRKIYRVKTVFYVLRRE